MEFAGLLEDALEEAGTAVAIATEPGQAAGAILAHVNAPFARMLALSPASLIGARLDRLEQFCDDPAGWRALMTSLASGEPLQYDMRLRVGGAEAWFGFRLTYTPQTAKGARHGVLIGRDLTMTRRTAAQGANLQRLLAEIFLRIAAPVAIVNTDGMVVMCNTALCELLGYRQDELKGANLETLLAPEHASAAAAARAAQLRDGLRLDMQVDCIAKAGARLPLKVTSILLRDGEQRLRVVTMLPRIAGEVRPSIAAAVPPPPPRDSQAVGELRALSLAAFRAAFGPAWEQMSLRAMLKAEQILRRRLAATDVLSRDGDNGFVIWFASTDEDRNEAVLDAAVREIRLRFLADFGEAAAAHVTAKVVPAAERLQMSAVPAAETTGSTDEGAGQIGRQERLEAPPTARNETVSAWSAPEPPAPPKSLFEQMLRSRRRTPSP